MLDNLLLLFRRARRLVRSELGTVIGLGLITGALFVFLEVVDEVREGEVRPLDERIIRALREPQDVANPIGPPWLELAMNDVTALGGTAVLTLITLVVVGYLLIENRRGAALWVLIAVGGGTLLSLGLKELFVRPRPDLVSHLAHAQGLSFPSGHAMLSAVTYLTLGALLMRIEARRRVKAYVLGVCVLLTLMIGSTRVYLGVHWPSDVLAGWAVGSAWAIACWLATLWLQRRGAVEDESGKAGRAPGRPQREAASGS